MNVLSLGMTGESYPPYLLALPVPIRSVPSKCGEVLWLAQGHTGCLDLDHGIMGYTLTYRR